MTGAATAAARGGPTRPRPRGVPLRNSAIVETLKDGFDTPTGATQVGNVAWVSETQFGFLFDPAKKGQKPAPFRIYPVPVK